MADDEVEDLEERRRIGLEMQARLPKSRPRPAHRLLGAAGDAGDLALLGDLGPVGWLLGIGAAVAWVLARRRRAAG